MNNNTNRIHAILSLYQRNRKNKQKRNSFFFHFCKIAKICPATLHINGKKWRLIAIAKKYFFFFKKRYVYLILIGLKSINVFACCANNKQTTDCQWNILVDGERLKNKNDKEYVQRIISPDTKKNTHTHKPLKIKVLFEMNKQQQQQKLPEKKRFSKSFFFV